MVKLDIKVSWRNQGQPGPPVVSPDFSFCFINLSSTPHGGQQAGTTYREPSTTNYLINLMRTPQVGN